MAFISKEELEKRLAKDENLLLRLNTAAKDENVPERKLDESKFREDGTRTDRPKLSEAQRAIIGATAILLGPRKAAAALDVSEGTAFRLKGDSPFKDEEKNKDHKKLIYEELGLIRSEARQKLSLCLDLVNEDTLKLIPDKDKAKIAAQMASQLSAVIDRTIQKAPQESSGSHLHLYAPNQRKLESFDIRKIGETPIIDVEGEVSPNE